MKRKRDRTRQNKREKRERALNNEAKISATVCIPCKKLL
jgi:hypothetical protein